MHAISGAFLQNFLQNFLQLFLQNFSMPSTLTSMLVRVEGIEKFCKNWTFQCEFCGLEKQRVIVRLEHFLFTQKAPFINGVFSRRFSKEKCPTLTVASFFLFFFVRPQASSRMYHFLQTSLSLICTRQYSVYGEPSGHGFESLL